MSQPITKLHAELISFLDISGPFLSLPVLTATFPQGFDVLEENQANSMRADYEYWTEKKNESIVHTTWIKLVLESLLGFNQDVLVSGQRIAASFKADLEEYNETIRPDMMLVDPETGKPRLMIQIFPPAQSLDKVPEGARKHSSIKDRMMELLHATEVKLGLITNGEEWMLVYAPLGETTGFTTWYGSLWFEEKITLRAFKSILGIQRFFGVSEDQTLEHLLIASASDQQEVTDQLGLQVRHAVEILVQKIDDADQDSGGKLLGKDVAPSLLFEASLTVMMRLVFLLAAEERKLLPIDDILYAENYAISTLRGQLHELADEEVLERRYDAWSRLLATFRAVYGGIHHDRLNLLPYGGSLFDPEKYPFLEGRRVEGIASEKVVQIPIPVNNRTVLHLLDALQMLQVEGEARRISFRSLDVEQIGHVYEGLLDHQAVRASETFIGLRGAKRNEPEVALSDLEKARGKKESEFLDQLNEWTGRTPASLKNSLIGDIFQSDPNFISRLRAKCPNEEIYSRILPFVGLIRLDDFGNPIVIREGSVFVTTGTTRRATGTHYTPRSLTEPIVQHTLEPLVYIGPAEGLPREEWKLRKPEEILDLKICDMAMGSAGFLVQVVRYLTERLMEGWKAENSEDLPPDDADRLIYAKRLVAERCIYGVDKNPLAVEIAKLSVWLETLAKDLPFGFLDHALKCGDSLVGADEEMFKKWAFSRKDAAYTLDYEVLKQLIEQACQIREVLESFTVRDVHDANHKAELLKAADAAMARVKLGCDLLVGVRLLGLKPAEQETLLSHLLWDYVAGLPMDTPDAQRTLHAARKECAFHWQFEFPEVFEKKGFSSIVGNPPFMGGRKIRESLGDNYREALYDIYKDSSGNADYCAFFFLKGSFLLRAPGTLGLIATNSIAQGDTRQTGFDRILISKSASIFRANTNRNWPGMAAVTVNVVHIAIGIPKLPCVLNDISVNFISNLLDAQKVNGDPQLLKINQEKSFQGTVVVGSGFILEQNDALRLLSKDKNIDVIKPYLVGADLNSSPTQEPSRWIINFFDYSVEKASTYKEPFQILQEKVYPIRMKVNREAHRKYWWHYGDKRPALYKAISSLSKVLVCGQVSKYLSFVFIPNGFVYDQKLVVFIFEKYSEFSILQSNLHGEWAWKYSSTMRNAGISYSPTDVFYTFPFPSEKPRYSKILDGIGEKYHQYRAQIMLNNAEGLTSTCNHFHDKKEKSADIAHLRELHVEMDNAVAAAYDWSDLDLGHDFRETPQGVRFTISEEARREVLSRLLQLNHERYEEEVRQGLHEKDKKKTKEEQTARQKPKKLVQPEGQINWLAEPDVPDEAEAVETLSPTPTSEIGSWDRCKCLACGKPVMGFSIAEHTQSEHQGKDPGYRKIG